MGNGIRYAYIGGTAILVIILAMLMSGEEFLVIKPGQDTMEIIVYEGDPTTPGSGIPGVQVTWRGLVGYTNDGGRIEFYVPSDSEPHCSIANADKGIRSGSKNCCISLIKSYRSCYMTLSIKEIYQDDDSDNVINLNDACPGTPWGEPVDESGCSESQLDDDGDGVSNAIDACPSDAGDRHDGCPSLLFKIKKFLVSLWNWRL